ncbi:hypothetical protein KIN20_029666 [Parelaphostrongylus tenuis]|uniref:Uncharacterized protein n=1 Tax=Parelaphostrongylus tenuis TaxID=148309 RepID=A0AAD5R2R6_PARTN|nr:hypothetical protein KIN20_029666 [Parelaphostrongylus tenuis]
MIDVSRNQETSFKRFVVGMPCGTRMKYRIPAETSNLKTKTKCCLAVQSATSNLADIAMAEEKDKMKDTGLQTKDRSKGEKPMKTTTPGSDHRVGSKAVATRKRIRK